MRTRMLGPEAPPLPVIGPRPLRRVLAAVAQLEPMAFRTWTPSIPCLMRRRRCGARQCQLCSI